MPASVKNKNSCRESLLKKPRRLRLEFLSAKALKNSWLPVTPLYEKNIRVLIIEKQKKYLRQEISEEQNFR